MNEKIDDFYYMKEALKEAKKAKDKDEIPIGCVVVKNNIIIGRGHNLVESNNNPLRHAELIAIEDASKKIDNWRFNGCTLYVTLEPCAMCSGALVYSRMDRVVFGAYDYKRGYCGSIESLPTKTELNHKVEILGGVMEKECLLLIQDFFKKLRIRNKAN
ncbi:tRNA adenosine(34) deaminase TadA [Miniphocaeibacter halophilus]|uniref:Nucleoside deaminase n=1 Tax=Miniphocaeibacter halophilus TaxID=2931922 RepID=A0AC61MR03_9FIRM|nr:tRNA adenosine(34) deaminase TadA [Miniphocaeibacter halophilus]QQK08019.1 nucleoside deaminase [Miniphocaeibacter halophilus]